MRFGTCRGARCILALSALFLSAKTASPETLRQALAGHDLTPDAKIIKNLDKDITSGAELDDANQFVIAYYVDDGSGLLKPPLFLDRYDRKSKEWKSVALTDAPAMEVDTPCFGSVLNIRAGSGLLYLDTHVSPSAGCLLVLTSDLKLEASLYGWLLGQLGTDLLVYHRSQVHFAPVHAAEIALYDLRTKRDTTIFPPKEPTSVRQARVAQLREFYKPNEEWCNKNNDPCDPESFDSRLQGPVAASDADSVLAFLISYEQIQYVPGELQKPSGPKDILYVYRHVDDTKMQVREMAWNDAKARFGDVPLEKLLQRDILQKIFGDVPARKP
jgi:hypothetical protein